MTLRLGDRQIVTYIARARNRSGQTATTSAITYAAGAPLTQATVLSIFNIPWETARPVWWHTSTAGGSKAADKIDVGFFPAGRGIPNEPE